MSRERWIYDRIAKEVVSADEFRARQDARSAVKRFEYSGARPLKRGTYLWRRGQWVHVSKVRQVKHQTGIHVISDIQAYRSPICDANGVHPLIDGRAAQREDLKRHGCRIKEPSETLRRAGVPKPAEPVITRAMERTAVEAYERSIAQQNR